MQAPCVTRCNLMLFLIRLFITLSASLIFLSLFYAVFLGFIPYFSEFTGLIIGLIFLVIFLLVGDKIILAMIQSKLLVKNQRLFDRIHNFCFRLNTKNISVYTTKNYGPNIYFLDSLWGNPSLVIAGNIDQILSKAEFDVLLFASLVRIRTKDALYRTQLEWILCVFYPPLLISKIFLKKSIHNIVVAYYLHPFRFLKKVLFGLTRSLNFHNKTYGLPIEEKDFRSSVFKITNTLKAEEADLLNNMISKLSVIDILSDHLLYRLTTDNPVMEKQLSKTLR